jgi:hypothetical protein
MFQLYPLWQREIHLMEKTVPASPNPTDSALRQFLVNSLRAYQAGEKTPPAAPPALDWEALIPLAEFHRVTPLLALALREGGASAVPAPAQAALAAAVRAGASRSLFMIGELARLLQQLAAQGVSAIPFKGPALAAQLYGDPTLRGYSDLDILVRQPDVPTATQTILSLGYQTHEQHSYHDSFRLERGALKFRLELHWHLMILPEVFPFTPHFDQAWERCKKLPFAGGPVLSLAPEDLLLFLCAHGSRHLWFRLQWICDIAQLLRRYPTLDWAALLERARAAGGQRMLFLGLTLAQELLGAPLPPEAAAAVRRDAQAARLARRVEAQFYKGPLAVLKPWKETLFPLQMIDCWPDRLTYLPRLWLKQLRDRHGAAFSRFSCSYALRRNKNADALRPGDAERGSVPTQSVGTRERR